MAKQKKQRPSALETRAKLLDAALVVMRQKGFVATSVDDLCAAAGLTKGAFFHHFASKEALGIAAAEHFGEMAAGLFQGAPYRAHDDPAERVLGYVDFRIAILQGRTCDYTCLLGTFVQEVYETHPAIRAACDRELTAHVDDLAADLAAAKARHVPEAAWEPRSLAFHMQAVLQGALIFAKAQGGPAVAAESLRHLRTYLELLLHPHRAGSAT